MKIGRKKIPNWEKQMYGARPTSFSLTPQIIALIDSCKMRGETRSQFITKLVRNTCLDKEKQLKLEIMETEKKLSFLQDELAAIRLRAEIKRI